MHLQLSDIVLVVMTAGKLALQNAPWYPSRRKCLKILRVSLVFCSLSTVDLGIAGSARKPCFLAKSYCLESSLCNSSCCTAIMLSLLLLSPLIWLMLVS